MSQSQCYICKTQDFTEGIFDDLSVTPEKLAGRTATLCLGCGVEREQAGAVVLAIPTVDQLSAETDWLAQGVGIN